MRPPVRRHVLAVAIVVASLIGPSVAVAAPAAPADPAASSELVEVRPSAGDHELGPVRPGPRGVDVRSRGVTEPDDCGPVLPGVRAGTRALRELGDRLPEVAARNGHSVDELRALLRDPTLNVDRCGALFYVDPGPAEPEGADETSAEHAEHAEHADHADHAGHDHGGPATAARPEAATAAGPTVEAATAAGPTVEAAAAAELPAPLSQTFALQSRPGSQRTLYLDFNGRTLTGTAWNEIIGTDPLVLAPFDLDGEPVFSEEERALIQRVWQQVAEDFAPFDLNVTTQDLGPAAIERTDAADQTFGTRALITDHDPATSGICAGCAGVAFKGVFDLPGSAFAPPGFYQPALVFSSQIEPDAQMLADTISHEVGHNLDLAHQSDSNWGEYSYGQGLWAPIMGSSLYPLTTWSGSDYRGATRGQDDVAVIASAGAPLAADDHGDDAVSATVLGAAASIGGVIERRTDEDWFRFTADGPTRITAQPSPEGPNLDLELQVLAGDGATVLGTDDAPSAWPYFGAGQNVVLGVPVTGLDARLDLTLAAGTYHARVRGVGSGDPLVDGYSDYGSLGRYTLEVAPEGAVPPPPVVPPVVTITSGPPALTKANSVNFAFTSDKVGTAFSCRLNAGPWQSCTSPRTVTTTSQGAQSFQVRGTVGDATSSTAGYTWTVDSVAPVVTITGTPAQGASVTSTSADLDWSANEPLAGPFSCRLTVAGSTGPWQSDCGTGVFVSGLPTGAHRIDVRGTDLAGNLGTASRSWTVTGSTPPPSPPPGPAPTFSDVPSNHAHARAIAILASRNVTGGCTKDGRTFCPDQPVTREQMATFLARALQLPAGSSSPPFVDVAAGGTHAANIDAVRRADITRGCTRDGRSFCPRDTVARDQMASFLQRARGYPVVSTSPPFRDVPAGSTHAGPIDALVRNNVTQGCSTFGSYCPKNPVTRGQMATFIARAMRWM